MTARAAMAGLDPCVHCGFCLSACPTYEVTGDEADSPRGRIVLMRALELGELPANDAALQQHLDACLGCRGCETVCPSGVIFGPALEASRARIEQVRPLPFAMRAALWILAYPRRQKLLWLVSRLLRATGIPAMIARGAGPDAPIWVRMLAMLAATNGERGNGGTGEREDRGLTPARSPVPPFPRALLFRGCVQQGLFRHVHDATITALAHNGVGVGEVPGQVCCGALAAHAGNDTLARELARANVRAFEGEETIVVNSAGCGAMLKSYGDWVPDGKAFAARVKDVSEILADRIARADPRPAPTGADTRPLRVAYDAPCHLLHAQKVAQAPLQLLAAVPGLELVPLPGSERCCGSAGLYSMIEPGMSADVLELKLAAIRATAPDVVATGNPGCIMQIGAGALLSGMRVDVRHPVELLAWSYRS